MQRRRRTKYTWLPADGQVLSAGPPVLATVPFTVTNIIPGGAGSDLYSTVLTSVIADFPQTDQDNANTSLADEIGSEYFLKRIVGKVFVEAKARVAEGIAGGSNIDPAKVPTAIVTVGFFIAPFDPADVGAPIGSNADFQRYNPLNTVAIRQPWIWRRSWVLSPIGNIARISADSVTGIIVARPAKISTVTGGDILGQGSFPSTNAGYPGVLDGPHIDAKTARRVRLHERLWVAQTTQTLPEGSEIDSSVIDELIVNMTVDVRCLGALRKARNRSNFA